MEKKKDVVYMVTYIDDDKKKHMTFVKGFSSIRFLEDRFENIQFEKTETYIRSESFYDYD